MDSTATQICQAKTKSGDPCQNPTIHGRPFCWWHDPELAEQRAEARSKGGRARHGRRIGTVRDGGQVQINSLSDVVDLVTSEINAVRGLEVSISRGRAIGYLAGVLVQVYTQSELEQRIAALEEKIT